MHQAGLLERVVQACQVRHYSPKTAKAYASWVKRFVLFHDKRHPAGLAEPEITQFLNHLAIERRVSASTQNQALSAILFLYRHVVRKDLKHLEDIARAKPSQRLPVVLSREEVRAVLAQLSGAQWLMAMLMYGSGLRLMECVRLRVKDIEFEANYILVRAGKGSKDRRTLFPERVRPTLREHLRAVRTRHVEDVKDGAGWVELPESIGRKYPNAGRAWSWQWVFPATRHYRDPATGQLRRHHYHESALQRAFKDAVHRARIYKPATCHTLRHYPERPIIPSRGVRLLRRPCLSPLECWPTRDNHSASRNRRRASPGRKRLGLTPDGWVRARAFSFRARSACR
jgi:integron integrase